ncbi:MAG: hypothetical protein ACTSUI_04620 [Promethearchaeota archaeon]
MKINGPPCRIRAGDIPVSTIGADLASLDDILRQAINLQPSTLYCTNNSKN